MRPKNLDLGLGIWLDTCPVCGKYREASEIESEVCIECYSYFHRSKYELFEDWLTYRLSSYKYKSRTGTQKDKANQRKRQNRIDAKERLSKLRLEASEEIVNIVEKLFK